MRSSHLFALGALSLTLVSLGGCYNDSLTNVTVVGDGGTTSITTIVTSDGGLPNKVRTLYCTYSVQPTYTDVAIDAGAGALDLTYTETDFDDGSVYMSSSIVGAKEGPYGSPAYSCAEGAAECGSVTFTAMSATVQATNSTFWTLAQGGTPAITTPFKVFPLAAALRVGVNTYPLDLTTNALPTNVSNGYFYYDNTGGAHAGAYQAPGSLTLSVDRGFYALTITYQDPDLNGTGSQTWQIGVVSACTLTNVDGG